MGKSDAAKKRAQVLKGLLVYLGSLLDQDGTLGSAPLHANGGWEIHVTPLGNILLMQFLKE